MRYIGGKTLLIEYIIDTIKENTNNINSVIDIFSGSAAVSNALKSEGYRVLSNDFLYFSYCISRGTVGISDEPQFNKFNFDVFDYLNNLTIKEASFSLEDCFIYNNYSPNDHCNRMYFRNDNAIRIDLIRLTIEKWKNEYLLTEDEYYYLLAALINAVPYVANIAGVFGAYLKFWDDRTYKRLKLERPQIIVTDKKMTCTNLDYKEILHEKYDLLYADPPYNSREYLPNYHLLETIARYDRPEIYGVTGMRGYDGQKSDFCKKTTVRQAFEMLVRDCESKYLLISYNNEGLISTNDLTEICQEYAVGESFKLKEIDYRRYKSKISNNKPDLKEQLYFLRRH